MMYWFILANFFEEDPFSKNAQSIAMVMHKALILMKFFQTKPQIKKLIPNKFDLFYTLILNLSDGAENWGFMKIISNFL